MVVNNMKLGEFINHIKHNSLYIDTFGYDLAKQYFTGAIGTYKTSVVKSKINELKIGKIEPLVNSLNIFIKDGE